MDKEIEHILKLAFKSGYLSGQIDGLHGRVQDEIRLEAAAIEYVDRLNERKAEKQ